MRHLQNLQMGIKWDLIGLIGLSFPLTVLIKGMWLISLEKKNKSSNITVHQLWMQVKDQVLQRMTDGVFIVQWVLWKQG